MDRFVRFVRPILFSLLLCFPLSSAIAADVVHGIDKGAMDVSVNPGDDFYSYANGGWMKATEIPVDKATWGTFGILREEAVRRTNELIQDASKKSAPKGSAEEKVGYYYAALMDEETIEKRGIQPLKADLERVGAISNKQQLARALGSTVRADVDALNCSIMETENIFGLWTAPDFSDSDHYVAYLLQGGLGMPDREYYLSNDPKMEEMRKAYQDHVTAVLKLAGIEDPETKAARILELEHKIATAHVSREESEDVLKANNPWTPEDFKNKAPGIDWTAFFEGAGLAQQKRIYAWHPHAFTGIAAAVNDTDLNTWKDYLTFHLINRASIYMGRSFVEEHFNFHDKVLLGTPQMPERWKNAVELTNTAVGQAVGQLYVAKYFTPQAKAAALEMVNNIKKAFAKRIDALDWMTPETRAKAKDKVGTLYVGIGYPDRWRDYSSLIIKKDDALGNWQRSEAFELHRQAARLGMQVDRGDWCMTPQTVNAVNLPLQNALNFPAAILEPPFFDAQADPAVNYGAIGAVIGHEISHSFDDQGSQFDAKGRLFNWWTDADFKHFKEQAENLAKQYDSYAPFPDVHVNGHLTLSENIADVAGLAAAFDAWMLSLNGKQPHAVQDMPAAQVFFIAYANNWRFEAREAAYRRQLMTNGHAPGPYRAAEVRNTDAWYTAFDVKPGDKLYLPPAERIRIW